MKVIELHHVGFGVNHAQADAMLDFYRNVLALPQDPSRWKIPGIYGSWFNLPNGTQLHILGCEGVSQYSKGPDQDPVSNHFALAVEDILAAEQELLEQGIQYFTLDNVASPNLKQLFLRDPAGNLIELHQATARSAGVAADEQQTGPIANR